MRRLVAFFILAAFLFSYQPAQAQGEPKLSSVDVWIWPEYDQPSILVIYHITVSSDTSLPATMTFRIPAEAVKPHALAIGPTANAVTDVGVEYSLKTEGKWVNVTIQVTGPAIQLEYYDPRLNKQGTGRDIVYEWPGDYAVDSLKIELQQPFDADNLTTNPSLGTVNAIPNGLTYYSGNFGPLQAGETFSLNTTYQKKTDDVSVSLMPVETTSPVDENTAGRVSLSTYLPWLIAGVGVLLISGGLYFYFRGQPATKQVRRRHASADDSAEGPTYCAQCGTRSRPNDRFCRVCGSRLRSSE